MKSRIIITIITAAAAIVGMTSAALAGSTTATVKAINAADGKITLKHGPLPDLGMPAMTMVFSASPAKLKNLKSGQVRPGHDRPNERPSRPAVDQVEPISQFHFRSVTTLALAGVAAAGVALKRQYQTEELP